AGQRVLEAEDRVVVDAHYSPPLAAVPAASMRACSRSTSCATRASERVANATNAPSMRTPSSCTASATLCLYSIGGLLSVAGATWRLLAGPLVRRHVVEPEVHACLPLRVRVRGHRGDTGEPAADVGEQRRERSRHLALGLRHAGRVVRGALRADPLQPAGLAGAPEPGRHLAGVDRGDVLLLGARQRVDRQR